jgi:hypothetical protein
LLWKPQILEILSWLLQRRGIILEVIGVGWLTETYMWCIQLVSHFVLCVGRKWLHYKCAEVRMYLKEES